MKNRKEFEAVAFSGVQYAPALCLWREMGDVDTISCGIEDCARVGYIDDAGQPASVLRWSKIYTAPSGRCYVRHSNRRFYLDEFVRVS